MYLDCEDICTGVYCQNPWHLRQVNFIVWIYFQKVHLKTIFTMRNTKIEKENRTFSRWLIHCLFCSPRSQNKKFIWEEENNKKYGFEMHCSGRKFAWPTILGTTLGWLDGCRDRKCTRGGGNGGRIKQTACCTTAPDAIWLTAFHSIVIFLL